MFIRSSSSWLVLVALLCLRVSAQGNIPGVGKLTEFHKELIQKGPKILYGDNPKRMTVTSPNYKAGHMLCLCSPTGANPPSAAVEKTRKAIESLDKPFSSFDSFTWQASCLNTSITDCINADASLRDKVKTPLCSYDAESGGNLYTYVDENKREDGLAVVQKCDVISRTYGLGNEGCVAVEHLKGYVLQHRHHLMREVLCGRGFCATPNHAIIVQGRTTSMKELCSTEGWECISTRKLVNNLKIAENTRAVAGDVTITPYDIRFPVAAIWAVQIFEDGFSLISSAAALAVAVAMVLLLFSKIEY